MNLGSNGLQYITIANDKERNIIKEEGISILDEETVFICTTEKEDKYLIAIF